jgi:NitT/TauT family transport system permease protein
MAAVFGYGVYDRTLRVVIPQVFPYIAAAARFGFGIVWKVVVVVELLGLTDGVGYQLNYYFQLFDMAKVFAWTLMFTVVMIMIELLLLKPIERRVFRWRPDVRA